MRKCLAPFFIGCEEPGLDRGTSAFDVVLPKSLAAPESGSENAINRINCAIRDFVTETVLIRERPVVLSGDCLSAIGCLAGLEKCGIRPYLLWFDAHGDFHTPETTISGHLGGMPLAMITRRGDPSHLAAVGLTSIPDERVCHIGGRALEIGEEECLRSSGVRRAERVTQILKDLPSEPPVWVHFDTDYIAPNQAPAMRYPAEGGISAREVAVDLDALGDKARILGMSISGWAPHLDENARTATICWNTASACMSA